MASSKSDVHIQNGVSRLVTKSLRYSVSNRSKSISVLSRKPIVLLLEVRF